MVAQQAFARGQFNARAVVPRAQQQYWRQRKRNKKGEWEYYGFFRDVQTQAELSPLQTENTQKLKVEAEDGKSDDARLLVFALRAAHLRNPVATAEIINGVYGLTLQILNHDLEKAAKLLEKRLATGDDSPWHAELSFTSYIAAAYYALLCCFFNRLPAPFSLKALVLAWDDSTKAKAEYRGVNVFGMLGDAAGNIRHLLVTWPLLRSARNAKRRHEKAKATVMFVLKFLYGLFGPRVWSVIFVRSGDIVLQADGSSLVLGLQTDQHLSEQRGCAVLERLARVARRLPDLHRLSNDESKGAKALQELAALLRQVARAPMGSGSNLSWFEDARKEVREIARHSPHTLVDVDQLRAECPQKDIVRGFDAGITLRALQTSRFFRLRAVAKYLAKYKHRVLAVLRQMLVRPPPVVSCAEQLESLAAEIGDDEEMKKRLEYFRAPVQEQLPQQEQMCNGDSDSEDEDEDVLGPAAAKEKKVGNDAEQDPESSKKTIQSLIALLEKTPADDFEQHVNMVDPAWQYHLLLLKVTQMKEGDRVITASGERFVVPGFVVPEVCPDPGEMMRSVRKAEGDIFRHIAAACMAACKTKSFLGHALAYLKYVTRHAVFKLYHPSSGLWLSLLARNNVISFTADAAQQFNKSTARMAPPTQLETGFTQLYAGKSIAAMADYVVRLYSFGGTDYENEGHWRMVSWCAKTVRKVTSHWKLSWARCKWLANISKLFPYVDVASYSGFDFCVNPVTLYRRFTSGSSAAAAPAPDVEPASFAASQMKMDPVVRNSVFEWASGGILNTFDATQDAEGASVFTSATNMCGGDDVFVAAHNYHFEALEAAVYLTRKCSDDEFKSQRALSQVASSCLSLSNELAKRTILLQSKKTGSMLLLADEVYGLTGAWSLSWCPVHKEFRASTDLPPSLEVGLLQDYLVAVPRESKTEYVGFGDRGFVLKSRPLFEDPLDAAARHIGSLTRDELNSIIRTNMPVLAPIAASSLPRHDALKRDIVRVYLTADEPAEWDAEAVAGVDWGVTTTTVEKIKKTRKVRKGNGGERLSVGARAPRRDLGRVKHPHQWHIMCQRCGVTICKVYKAQLKENQRYTYLYCNFVDDHAPERDVQRPSAIWESGVSAEELVDEMFVPIVETHHKCTNRGKITFGITRVKMN